MERRRITPVEVAEALLNRESTYPGRPEPRVVVLGRTTSGRRLKVVLATLQDDDDVVVTVADRDEEA